MPGIIVSPRLVSEIPESEVPSGSREERRKGLIERLWNKSGGVCFLCEDELNRVVHDIAVDHDIPVEDGGLTVISNLNLTHDSCNKAKRGMSSERIRPYLKLKKHLDPAGGPKYYGDCLALFSIVPGSIEMTTRELGDGRSVVHVRYSDGTVEEAFVMQEKDERGRQREFVFLLAPRAALHNDHECQPRPIKLSHVWDIHNDLRKNPVHEPPGCRLVADTSTSGVYRMLMFDGQHKSLAAWLSGRERIAVKLYLTLTKYETIELVNSIQSKIGKLPLTPLEFTRKMNDEFEPCWMHYVEANPTGNWSEAAFLKSLDKADQTRAKQALMASVATSILSFKDLELLSPDSPFMKNKKVTDRMIKTKLLDKMIHQKPLVEMGEKREQLRNNEAHNVILGLNMLTDSIRNPALSNLQLKAPREIWEQRLMYQGSLQFIAGQIRAIFGYFLTAPSPREFLIVRPDEVQTERIAASIRRLLEHPVWYTLEAAEPRMKEVINALQKNQNVETVMDGVGLEMGYIVGAKNLKPW